jgi:ABC-type amino acid transport substrate-binding protein
MKSFRNYAFVALAILVPALCSAQALPEPQLRDAALAPMRKLVANGTYSAIIAKWNLQSSAVKRVSLNGEAQP